MTPLESAFRVPPLSNQLPQVQPARQTVPWHEIWEIQKNQSNHGGFKEPSMKQTGYIRPVHLHEKRCPSIYFWDRLQGPKSRGNLVEQIISMWGLSCRSEMIPLCVIQLKPTKWNPWDPEEWCRVHVFVHSPSDKLKLHKTSVLKGSRWLRWTSWLQVQADLKAWNAWSLAVRRVNTQVNNPNFHDKIHQQKQKWQLKFTFHLKLKFMPYPLCERDSLFFSPSLLKTNWLAALF